MQFGVRAAPVSRPAPVAPGPSDPSPAPTMVGATELIVMAIGIRAMTKWKAESYSVVAHNADPYLELTQGRSSASCSGAVRYVCSITSKALSNRSGYRRRVRFIPQVLHAD
jgi:hypothetical protein